MVTADMPRLDGVPRSSALGMSTLCRGLSPDPEEKP